MVRNKLRNICAHRHFVACTYADGVHAVPSAMVHQRGTQRPHPAPSAQHILISHIVIKAMFFDPTDMGRPDGRPI